MSDDGPITTLHLTGMSAVADVRHRVAAICRDHGVNPDELPLVAYELAVNAIRHGRKPAQVTVLTRGNKLVVRVTDARPCALPGPAATDTESETGRGLAIARELSEFSWRISGNHKHAEAAVPLPPGIRQPAPLAL
ncbi:MAG: ATP-binding protein [Streptomycetaceae bacterium]|nr:ATP-binding protein [Streptomycetaceae bacterium]